MGLSGMSLAWLVGGARGKERKRGSLGKRPEDEFALGDANVRNGKALMVDLKVVVEKNVKVDVARSLVDEFLAA
jgi:hypothetical protein